MVRIQNIFLRNACKHPVIVLTGIKYMHIKSLIDFIYNGEVNIYQEHLSELLRVANILKIKGLDEVASNEMNEDTGNRKARNDSLPNMNTDDNWSDETSKRDHSACSTKQNELNLPSTSDQTKSAKKRKSVSFSDTPEIVCDQYTGNSQGAQIEGIPSDKRKLRSLSDICSITKIKNENDEHSGLDDEEKPIKRGLIVTINPHSLYSSTDSLNTDDNQVTGSAPKKQRANTSRKMIRKNENFLRALEAVRDEGIGFCKAAKIHGVNNRTLWLEYQKLGYPMKNARKKSQSSL